MFYNGGMQVTSKKDQAQYWADPSKPYQFIPVSDIAAAFRSSKYGDAADSKLATPFDKSSADPSALCRTQFAISGWENLKVCFRREMLLINRHRFLYTFRTCQVLNKSTYFSLPLVCFIRMFLTRNIFFP